MPDSTTSIGLEELKPNWATPGYETGLAEKVLKEAPLASAKPERHPSTMEPRTVGRARSLGADNSTYYSIWLNSRCV